MDVSYGMTSMIDTFSGRRVLLTGHTGFKGAWLSLWLHHLGAEVSGFSLAPEPDQEPLFQIVNEVPTWREGGDFRGTLLDPSAVRECVSKVRPEFVFHLAAQSLVRRSYRNPVETFSVNVMGTAHLLDAIVNEAPEATVVSVTTDKCYENREWIYGYREVDALGGRDPYSASKAAAELVTAAWRASYFDGKNGPGRVATARAGNVVGGGDFAEDRIVPDLVRSLAGNRPLGVRSPHSTRPWQHVLDCLSGYLWLARWLASDPRSRTEPARSFNFGPVADSERSVGDLVDECLIHWPGRWEDLSVVGAPHESSRLSVSIERATALLGWRPRWNFEKAVAESMLWYRAHAEGASPSSLREMMLRQIESFEA